MTKKDYIALARAIKHRVDIIRDFHKDNPEVLGLRMNEITNIVLNVVVVLENDNPNFKRDTFLKACGLRD
jgi:hypothetical protein